MPGPMPYVEQGDIEAACIDILQNLTPELASYSVRVSSSLVGFSKGARWIEVIRQGGNLSLPKIDRPRVDFNVYAETRSVCHDIAQKAQASLFRAMGTYSGYGVKLCDVRMETGLYRDPDKFTDTPRFIFALRLTVVPSS